MAIKIFTYKNPYDLTGFSYWSEIKKYPHFCSSQVMVNALEMYYEKGFESLLCPLTNIIKNIYSGWDNNPEKWLSQYIDVSNQLRLYQNEASFPRELVDSFKKNQSSVVDAMRMLIEMDCQPRGTQFDDPVQTVFIQLFHELVTENNSVEDFRLDGLTSGEQLKDAIVKECIRRIEYEENRKDKADDGAVKEAIKERISRISRIKTNLGEQDLTAIVIHGVHQFTPLELRFISELTAIGIDVFFLFNYQREYAGIYNTWFKVYQPFDANIYLDQSSETYTHKNPSNALGAVYGKIFSDEKYYESVEFQDYLRIKSNVEFTEFDNITDCADYISKIYEKAKKDDPNNPMRASSEQFYSLTRDVQDLLRVYYPETAGSPHFLNYPIGQFFLSIYKLWDTEKKQINIVWDLLRICFISGFLNGIDSLALSRILYAITPMFEDVSTYEEFCNRLSDYKSQYKAAQLRENEIGPKLKNISLYCPTIITKVEDIELVEKAVADINHTANLLFSTKDGEKLSFMDHFRKLQELLESKVESIVLEEEQNLIRSLLERITEIKTSMSGTISDLQQGIYYFLKQKDTEKPDWIVRDFVQIEGDILRSRIQSGSAMQKEETIPTYHFLGLSDQNMNSTPAFPWPINADYIQQPVFASCMPFQVFYNSLTERSHFNNYALFYGLYYNECNLKLSYIRDNGDEKLQPYSVFRILGLAPVNHLRELSLLYSPKTITQEFSRRNFNYDNPNQARDFFLCPDKFFYDYCCQGDIVKNNTFLLNYYYQNLLIYLFMKHNENKLFFNVDRNVFQELGRISQKICKYFPFFSEELDIFDIKVKAKNYLVNNAINNHKVNKMGEYYDVRLLFGKYKYYSDSEERHSYPAFNALINIENNQRTKSLGKIRTISCSEKNDMNLYMNNPELVPSTGEWCNLCSYKDCCLEPYIKEMINSGEEE